MFGFFKKKTTLKDILLSLEKRINKTEKCLKNLKYQKININRISYILISLLISLFIYKILYKEFKIIYLFCVFGVILLRKILIKIIEKRIISNQNFLKTLKETQKVKVEEFKKDTEYMETKTIVEKYESSLKKPKISDNRKGILDMVTDAIIGDDPSTMYALICEKCYYHNGLVHPKDYNQTKFNCYHCKHFNNKMREA